MPIQNSKKAQNVTSAPYTAPFQTNMFRYGIKGLNITDAIDALEPNELRIMLNVTHRSDMALTGRPGQAALATAGTNHHTIRRLNSPNGAMGSYTRIFGVDSSLYIGQSGALTSIDSGYSGDPLTMVPYRPTFSSEPWMLVADRGRMRKVRADGLTLPMGLPAPTAMATAVLGTQQKTVIADMSSDGTQGGSWTNNAGFTYDEPPVVPPSAFNTNVTDPDGNQGVNFQTNPGIRTNGYYSYWGVAHAVNMSMTGAVPASDDDYIHLWLNLSHVSLIEEFRIYFVVTPTFDPTILPGLEGETNGDAYVKAFSGNDFADFIAGQSSQTSAAEVARQRSIRDQDLKDRAISDTRTSIEQVIAGIDPSRTVTIQSGSASDHWSEFGVIGVPIRRGDFQRIGGSGADWSGVTGIITMVKVAPLSDAVAVRLSALYMTGGSGPDTGEAGSSAYDYRYTHVDNRTGAEGNPSPTMTLGIDTLRRSITVTPTAYGDASIRQRIYRRGGVLPTDWYLIGDNASDGGAYVDVIDDTEAFAAGTVETDNDQPVTTVSTAGVTLYDQNVASIWGPIEDFIFACGDIYRPGHIYFSKRGNPDSWPSDYLTEVCSPSEELMAGCLFGGQSFVFSKERLFVLYPNLSGDSPSVTSTVTQCKKGLVSRWSLAVGMDAIYFVSRDGVYRSGGGPAEWLSKKIDPIFRGMTVAGMAPIDFSYPQIHAVKLEIHENELYFQYEDTQGVRQCLIYSIPYQFWRQYSYGRQSSTIYSDEGNSDSTLLLGGRTTGKTYTAEGAGDDGLGINSQARTGALNMERPREEKRLGDQMIDMDGQGATITIQTYLNDESVENDEFEVTPDAGRVRTIFDGFGDTPQRARNISTDVSWSSGDVSPIIYQLGTSYVIEPDITMNRVTQWDDLENMDESYVSGITLDCDTGGTDRVVVVEGDYAGAISTIATLSVNASGRHKLKFSWSAAQAHKVRLRPDDDCEDWILYQADWISQPEPPRISKWDTYFENGWDHYYTGVDLYCDTSGQTKTVRVYVDGNLITTASVVANGRRVVHITMPAGRGHVFHLDATDNNPGILYDVRWQAVAEPSEQANWNQNYTVAGTETDKWLKAVVIQCDTFNVAKTVTIEVDGVVVHTESVTANGRKVVQFALTNQALGRVFRLYPTDSNPGRFYGAQWVFDQEPLALMKWETQEITHGLHGWHYPTWGHVTVKSVDDVLLTLTAYNQNGDATTETYILPSTSGNKKKLYVTFRAGKGILYKYVLTSASPFWLYKEESIIHVREWGTDGGIDAQVFGNSDMDTTRSMINSVMAASILGGGSS